MDKVFSARMDEKTIKRIDTLARRMHKSKKRVLEEAIEYYSSQVAGNIDASGALGEVERRFAAFERRADPQRNLPAEPEQLTARRHEEEYPTDLARLAIGFKSVSLLDPDLYALDLLADMLGSGRSSRLYREMFDNRKLVYGIQAYNYTPADKGLFAVECTLDEANIKPAVEAIMEQIAALLPPEQRGVYSSDPAIRAAAQEAAVYPYHDLH